MKIDINAFLESLPIMGVGLLGIFIVTIVLILGIYILKAITSKTANAEETEDDSEAADEDKYDTGDEKVKKESALDLLKEREKKDFFEEVDNNYISNDL